MERASVKRAIHLTGEPYFDGVFYRMPTDIYDMNAAMDAIETGKKGGGQVEILAIILFPMLVLAELLKNNK